MPKATKKILESKITHEIKRQATTNRKQIKYFATKQAISFLFLSPNYSKFFSILIWKTTTISKTNY
ncbi:hypothetical protein HMPREF1436_01395 [Helicobacter pylori GAMchJs136i]|nr:hypothetical protein HMPREF1436_01395 [Helicobacter pylori GAMchJs136i]